MDQNIRKLDIHRPAVIGGRRAEYLLQKRIKDKMEEKDDVIRKLHEKKNKEIYGSSA